MVRSFNASNLRNMSKPLVILGSARKESDTGKFVDQIFEGVDYTLVDLLDLEINRYDYTHHYPSEDGYNTVVEEMMKHRTIVFATPVYWYAMSSLMKTVFDRFSDLVTYKKTVGRQLKGKNGLLIAVGADTILPDGFEIPFRNTADYLNIEWRGSIYHSTKSAVPDAEEIRLFRDKLL
jgi:putative NADPH-quinone reductase